MGKGLMSERPPVNPDHPSYITVYRAAGGYQTMCVWWNPDGQGYEEPWVTGNGPYRYEVSAHVEAQAWATIWGLELRVKGPPSPEPAPPFQETIRTAIPDIIEVDIASIQRDLRAAATSLEEDGHYQVFMGETIEVGKR